MSKKLQTIYCTENFNEPYRVAAEFVEFAFKPVLLHFYWTDFKTNSLVEPCIVPSQLSKTKKSVERRYQLQMMHVLNVTGHQNRPNFGAQKLWPEMICSFLSNQWSNWDEILFESTNDIKKQYAINRNHF